MQIIGWIASVITILMYAPQSFMTFRTKKVEGLSKIRFCLVAGGSGMWTVFAVAIHSWQAWSANGIVLLLMLPIFYHLFKHDSRIVIAAFSIIISTVATTLVLMILGVHLASPTALVASIFAGIGTGTPFVPQVFKTFKSKDISSISILTTWGVIWANVFWVAYYSLRIAKDFTPGDLVAVLFSFLGVVTSALMAFIYYKYKSKKK